MQLARCRSRSIAAAFMLAYPMTEPREPPSQADKFRELARELDCDEGEARFEEAVKRVAKAPLKRPEPE